MPKQKKLFTIKNKKNKINMNVDEHLYNHFQSLNHAQQKSNTGFNVIKDKPSVIIFVYHFFGDCGIGRRENAMIEEYLTLKKLNLKQH